MFEVQTKQVEELAYVSRSGRVRVSDLERFIVSAIETTTRSPSITAR